MTYWIDNGKGQKGLRDSEGTSLTRMSFSYQSGLLLPERLLLPEWNALTKMDFSYQHELLLPEWISLTRMDFSHQSGGLGGGSYRAVVYLQRNIIIFHQKVCKSTVPPHCGVEQSVYCHAPIYD